MQSMLQQRIRRWVNKQYVLVGVQVPELYYSFIHAEDRRRFLLNYVQHCDDPGVIIESFLEHAPTQARSPVHASTARHCRGLRALMPAQEQACCSP